MPDEPTDFPEDASTESFDGKRPDGPSMPPFEHLGSFRIERTISAGGMGTVYQAFDESMKRTVALKVLHPTLDVSPVAQHRFAREAWIAGKLEHPNIIKIYSRGEDAGYRFFAMEYADGGSLADYIKQVRTQVPHGTSISDTLKSEHINNMVRNFIEVAEALEQVHQQGFIHRDIKPHNILLAGKDKIFKLSDFGIAHADDMTKMTRAGDFIGTVKYMSPELLTAHRATVDKRTDIYSLGVTLYEALTLTLPYDADSDERYISKILAGQSVAARRRNPRIPRDLETVIMVATNSVADQRYQSAAAMADDLRRVLNSQPIKAKREGLLRRGAKTCARHRTLILVILIMTLLSAFTVYRMILHESKSLSEQQLASDRLRITAILEKAIESGVAPSELEPDWPRLSRLLVEELDSDELTTNAKLFLRAHNELWIMSYDKYTLNSQTEIVADMVPINYYGDRQPILAYSIPPYLNAAVIAEVEVSVDDGDFQPFFRETGTYSDYRTSRMLHLHSWSDFTDTVVSGPHSVIVRAISKHFLRTKLLIPIRDSTGEDIGIVRISPDDDTLVEVTESPSALVVALTSDYSAYAKPVMVDTVAETLSVFTFDEFPSNLPAGVKDPTIKSWFLDSARFDALTLSKSKSGELSLTLEMFVSEFFPAPLACSLQVIDLDDQETILSTNLYVFGNRFALGYRGERMLMPWWQPYGMDRPAIVSCQANALEIDSAEFADLVARDEIEALLRLVPAQSVAREFGPIVDFLSDTLEYSIRFKAEMQVEDSIEALK